jgi:hypothetical protein
VTSEKNFTWHIRIFDAKRNLIAREKQQEIIHSSPEQCGLNWLKLFFKGLYCADSLYNKPEYIYNCFLHQLKNAVCARVLSWGYCTRMLTKRWWQ